MFFKGLKCYWLFINYLVCEKILINEFVCIGIILISLRERNFFLYLKIGNEILILFGEFFLVKVKFG